MSKPRVYGSLAVFFGVLLVTGSRLLNQVATFTGRTTSADVLKDLGIAIFIFGLFNILVDLPEWKQYFEERIKQILIQQEYLDELDKDVLRQLETNVLKARFHSAALEERGSLHNFVRDHVQRFLPLPYFDNAHAEVIYESTSPGALLVTDRVSYTCRAVDGKVERNVQWRGAPSAFREVRGIRFEGTYPAGHADEGTTDILAEAEAGKRELIHRLADEHAIDGIRIVLTATYVIDEHKMQYWELERPVKGVEVTLKFPEQYTPAFVGFLPVENPPPTVRPGYFHFCYLDWSLRNCGFAWQLRPRSENAEEKGEAGVTHGGVAAGVATESTHGNPAGTDPTQTEQNAGRQEQGAAA